MIRNAGWLDIPLLLAANRRQRVIRLNAPYTIIQPETMLLDLVRAQNPLPSRRCYTLVYAEAGRVQGYIQARCRWQRNDEWTVTTLGSLERGAEEIWLRLLADLLVEAGERGIVRVFAKLPVDDEHIGVFRELGFVGYTREAIWGNLLLKGGGARPPSDALRPQRAVDAWNLMQLYRAVTPRVVQQAEALTSKQWQLGAKIAPGGLAGQGFVWDNAGGDGSHAAAGLGGWIRLLTGPKGHWITTLFKPDQRQLLPGALDYVLWLGQKTAPKPNYVALREYQAEVAPMLEERGFHLLSEQALLVKYTAVTARQEVPAFALNRSPKLVVSDW